jgi:CubicO group peptidase (beta-lactamase class C family)
MKKPYSFSLILLIFLALSCKKENTEPVKTIKTNNPLADELDKRINEIISPYALKSSTASISIGIFKDNITRYYGYGETQKGNGIIPDSTTIYEIGSITKTFTALLMMDYLQANALTIDCPINDLLPADIPVLQHNSKPILIKHLLNHTSGLPRLPDDFETGIDPDNPYKHYDSTRMYDFLKTFQLQKDPGQTWEYSNLAMGLAGVIMERQTHKSYEQLLLEKICRPLGMNQTKITLNGNDSLNFATGYNQFGFQAPYWDDLNAFKGAGAIRSNAKDLIAYGKTYIHSETSVLKTQIDSCLKITFQDENVKQASGWLYQTIDGADCIVHDGGTAGFNSYIIACKDKNIVMVLLFSNEPAESRLKYINELALEVFK